MTSRSQPHGSLPHEEPKFQALLESAPDAIIIVRANGQIAIANGQAERLFGYPRSELIGQPIEILLPEHLHHRHAHHRTAYASEPHTRPMGIGLDLVARRRDGSEFPVEISLSPLHTGDGLLITSVIRDITERKEAAAELERQVQRRTAHLNVLLQFSQELIAARGLDVVLQRALSQAMALVPEADHALICLSDDAGGRLLVRASAGFSPLPAFDRPIDLGIVGLAFTAGQARQVHSADAWRTAASEHGSAERLLDILHLDAPPSGAFAMPLLANQQAIGVLLLLRMADDMPFNPDARATLEALAHLTTAAILEDRRMREAATLSLQLAQLEEQQRTITDRLNTVEAGMLQAARMAAVGQLAAAIAHEINNPLYAARNCLHLLSEDFPALVSESPYMQIATDQLTRIAGIIERMRDFYRPARGELVPADLNQLLEDTLAIAALNMRHVAIQAIFAPTPHLPPVLGNADQLRQVFLNLTLNAIEAMPQGGTLTVRTLAGPTVAVVEVEDTGIGIPDDMRARLFEPFFTNKPNGTGLGLSISAHIVTQHGGQIEVESSASQGSIFRVVLPYRHPI
jgi:two-component system NtrC family sensor kinase